MGEGWDGGEFPLPLTPSHQGRENNKLGYPALLMASATARLVNTWVRWARYSSEA